MCGFEIPLLRRRLRCRVAGGSITLINMRAAHLSLSAILIVMALSLPSRATIDRKGELPVAAQFAPIFYEGLGELPRADYITNFDFDGDWKGNNNWKNLDNLSLPLKAYIYYSVLETSTHYFVFYAVFHPRDYKGSLAASEAINKGIRIALEKLGRDPTGGLADDVALSHENDLEGCLVVAAKNGTDLKDATVQFVETMAHNRYLKYRPGGSLNGVGESLELEGQHPILYVEPKGHGIDAYSGDEKQTAKKEFLIYKFAGKAEDPDQQTEGSVGYELLPIQTTLWPRAKIRTADKGTTYATSYDYPELSLSVVQANGRVAVKKIKIGKIGEAFAGDSGGLNMARPPWAWFDKRRRSDPLGLWFFDPARIIKRDFQLDDSFSTNYSHLPFWATN